MKRCTTAVFTLLALIYAGCSSPVNSSAGGSSGGDVSDSNGTNKSLLEALKQIENAPSGSTTEVSITGNLSEADFAALKSYIKLGRSYVNLDLSGANFTSVPRNVFYNEPSLIGIKLPNTVTEIGERAFTGADLRSVEIPKGVTSIGASAFSANYSLTSVTLPDTLITIGDNAFSGTSINSIILHEGLTTIGNNAFSTTKLTSIEIPASVKAIGYQAFDIGPLILATIKAETPPRAVMSAIQTRWAAFGFASQDSSLKIRVPNAALAEYKKADGWKEYAAPSKDRYVGF